MLDNGDSTLIKIPSGETILIDTGEEDNIIVEFLLDKGIKKINYFVISHFDSDHSGKATEIIERLNVENLIVSKQTEKTSQFEGTIIAAKRKNVNILQVEAGDNIKIRKGVELQILWPKNDKIVLENPINNNSIVCKFVYNNFSILFTGDIEEIAEKEIVKTYKTDELNATVLKVAHHGSKTSSTEEFIKKVNPKVALIGVGKNNKFGHPNEQIIERQKKFGVKIYRTDEDGEICISVDQKGRIKINKFIK